MATFAEPNMASWDSSGNLDKLADPTEPGQPLARTRSIRVSQQLGGPPMLWSPLSNKGTNFSKEERAHLRLLGLLPPVYETLELQAERVMYQLRHISSTPLQRYQSLAELASSNMRLFYKVLMDNLVELAPIVYTPTVGEACQKFDLLYRTPLGIYLSAYKHRGRFEQLLNNWLSHNVQIVVVTDGGRILGLGDLGTNGIGISIGKISLYVAGGGFHPEHSLPAVLDMGTNNKELLEDKFYMGQKSARLTGKEHMEVVEEFCMAVQRRWPSALIQFEDFQTEQAFEILHHMRDRCCCFNDDIQGTAAVVLAGLINGLRKVPAEDVRVLFYGAGSSAVGVAELFAAYLVHAGGCSKEEAFKRIYMVDSKGLVTTSRGDKLPIHKQSVARTDDTPNLKDLEEIINFVKPNALIGLSGSGRSFFRNHIEALVKHCECPLVFPLSNPTSKAEITAEEAYEWSGGKCVFASGSPFDPVTLDGTTYYPGQANNVLIFPGLGFGTVMAKCRSVRDQMLLAAAQACADAVSEQALAAGRIYPDLQALRSVSAQVAEKVMRCAHDIGVSRLDKLPDDLMQYITKRMWYPRDGDAQGHVGLIWRAGASSG